MDTLQKDTNWTTNESKDSDNTRYIIKEALNSLSSKRLMKKKIADGISNERKVSRLGHKLLSPQNNLNKFQIGDKLGVSRRFITLIDKKEDKNKKELTVQTKLKKPKVVNRNREITDISQIMSKSFTKKRTRINMSKTVSHCDRYAEENNDGDENYVESPCPRVRALPEKVYRNSLIKSESYPEFTLMPQLMNTTFNESVHRINLDEDEEDSSENSEIFDKAPISENDDYDLFDWSDEFDLIIDGTHPEVYPKKNKTNWDIKQIELIEHPKIDMYTKYCVIKQYMSIKATMLREVNKKTEKKNICRNKNKDKPRERLCSSFNKGDQNSSEMVNLLNIMTLG